MHTDEELRREDIKSLFTEFIKSEKVKLRPVLIECVESSGSVSRTKFVFEEYSADKGSVIVELAATGSGLVDCIFGSCMRYYADKYLSLTHMSLVDLLVRPVFSMSRTETQTDASTDVVLKMAVRSYDQAEFKNRSKSIVYSSFVCILSAFQFYINCEKTFDKLHFLVDEAENRLRSDLVEKYRYKISKITVVNSYEKKDKL